MFIIHTQQTRASELGILLRIGLLVKMLWLMWLQCTELVNVAMLTGKMRTHAMRIYAVSHSGRLSDVTSQTTCHSGDEDALKVSATIVLVCVDSLSLQTVAR